MIKVNANKFHKGTYIYDINYSRSEIRVYLAEVKDYFRLRHGDIGVSIWNQHMLR
jgi:hypothetical protein